MNNQLISLLLNEYFCMPIHSIVCVVTIQSLIYLNVMHILLHFKCYINSRESFLKFKKNWHNLHFVFRRKCCSILSKALDRKNVYDEEYNKKKLFKKWIDCSNESDFDRIQFAWFVFNPIREIVWNNHFCRFDAFYRSFFHQLRQTVQNWWN